MNQLRPKQLVAVENVFSEWQERGSTLGVAATGFGKTQVFCEIIRRSLPKRALILLNRAELAYQAQARLESFGIDAEIEMGDMRASTTFWNRSPCVISTVQTQIAGSAGEGRMTKFSPKDFSVLICDEAHFFTAPSFQKVLDYYKAGNPEIKIFGCTATPDRLDEAALGKIFESVAFDYDIQDLVEDGWLVRPFQQMVTIEGLDFSAIHTVAGDLNKGELADVMEAEKIMQGVASASIDILGMKRALAFCITVRQAEMLSDIFNRHKNGMSAWVCGKTSDEKRKEINRAFNAGEIQVLCNVGTHTTGFDSPRCEAVIMARPTKSRALYTQCCGRALRTIPGIVDGLESAEERKAAIAASAKPHATIVDLVGNSGRHKLVSVADVLGGKYEDDVIELAEKRVKEKGEACDMSEALEKAAEEIQRRKDAEAARKAKLVAKAKFTVQTINPFDVLDLKPERERGWDSGKTLTDKQLALLDKQGIDARALTYHQGKQVLNELFRRWNGKLATFKQVKALRKFGYETKDMTMKQASVFLDDLAKNGWNRARADELRRMRELDALPDIPF